MNATNVQPVGYKAKALEARNLAWYFLIVMGIPWLAMAPFVLRIVKFPATLGPGLKIVMGIMQFLPLIAAFLLTGLSEGKAGIKALWKRFWNRDLHIPWLLVALLLNPVIRLVNSLIDRAISGAFYPVLIPDFLYALLSGIVIGIQEEFGWRGYALPRFQAKWNALVSSLILGAIWAIYHVGNWLIPPDNPYRQGDFGWFAIWIICLSLFSTWIFNNTRGSVLAVVLYHASATNGLVNCCDGLNSWPLIIGTTLFAAVLVVIIFGPRTLVRQTPDARTAQESVRTPAHG